MNDLDLARLRRAYESGRLRAALPWAVPVLVLGVGAGAVGVPWAAPVSLVLSVAVVALRWWGRGFAAGVGPGLLAGLVAAVVPLVHVGTGSCHGACGGICLLHCSLGGIAAGAGLLLYLRRAGASGETVLASLAVASAAATLGCVVPGLIGLSGVMALTVLVSPALVVRRFA